MIQANDFRSQWLDTRDDTLAAVEAVGGSGWYILGGEVARFETDLASTFRRRHAVGVASGLDALEISLRALGCRPGDRVLTTPVSAFATTLAIAKIGAVPVFIDCDGYGLIDLHRCESLLEKRSDIRFLLPVHLYGHSLDLERLRRMRERYGVRIVEDCAQSILATHGDLPAGAVGDMSATSFYPTKNLGAIGDGGAIVTDDEGLAQQARMLRDYGQSGKYCHAVQGYNSRLDELQAAILRRAHLPRLAGWTERRRRIAQAYVNGISNPRLRIPDSPSGSLSCWHLFPVFTDPEQKRSFMHWMRDHDIMVGEHYPAAIVDQPAMSSIPHEMADPCDLSRDLCRSEVSLPIHPYLTAAEVHAVVDACNRWNV